MPFDILHLPFLASLLLSAHDLVLPATAFPLSFLPSTRTPFSNVLKPTPAIHSSLFELQGGSGDDDETVPTPEKSKIPKEMASSFQSIYLKAMEAKKNKELRKLDAEALRQRQQTGVLNCGLGISMVLWGTPGLLLRSVSCILLLYSGKLIFQNKKPLQGYKVANVVSAMLSWLMGRRHLKLGEPYVPSGVIATVALITLFYNGIDTMVAISEQKEET